MSNSNHHLKYLGDNREISLYVQLCIHVDVGHIFTVKINPYLTINETVYQLVVKL